MPARSIEYKGRVKSHDGELAICTAVFPSSRQGDVIDAMKFMRSVISPLVSGAIEIRTVMRTDQADESIMVEAVGFLRDRNLFGFLRGRNKAREIIIEKQLIAIAEGVSTRYFGRIFQRT
jgi:hypothetical protein